MPIIGMDGNAGGGGGGTSGADALMQLYDPQRTQRRNLMDFVRPMDSSAIAQVQAALGAGLDPSTAASLLGNLASGVTGRFDQYQTNRQDARSTATDALMQLAQTNPDPAAAQTYIDSYSQIHPGMGQQLSPTLEGLVGQLYPGGQSSPLYQDPNGPEAAQGLTPDDIAGVYQDAMVFAQGDQANGISPLPLHDARMRIMGQLRAQGYSEGDLQQAYDAIGSAYGAVGGPINAPLTSADRLAAMAPQASPAPAAPISAPAPTSTPFAGFQTQFPARPYG